MKSLKGFLISNGMPNTVSNKYVQKLQQYLTNLGLVSVKKFRSATAEEHNERRNSSKNSLYYSN